MKPRLSNLWRWNGNIERGTYLFWGALLFAIKLNMDRILSMVLFEKYWSIFDVETARFYLWQTGISEGDGQFYFILLFASLPFLWAGTVLTLGRLRSLHWNPWWVILFFVPVIKFLFFTVLCLLPANENHESSEAVSQKRSGLLQRIIPRNRLGSAALAILLTASATLIIIWFGTSYLGDYGWSLFVGVPFIAEFLTVLIYSFHEKRSTTQCLRAGTLTLALVAVGLLVVALEGVICIAMAAPFAFLVGLIGALMGHVVQEQFWRRNDSSRLFCLTLLILPSAMVIEHVVPPPLPLLKVTSSVVVDAAPEVVWKNVVSFSELPEPDELIFKLGIAYPIRAEIDGEGVGAIRYCNFSTGPFVEPIEVWDEPRLLKFSVTENPQPMQEWTPYDQVHPPHLDGYLESKAGQFQLTPLEDGRTLLEGTTWYQHRLWPSIYWQVWSDHIIHTIHYRVLNHVKTLSEAKDQ